MKEILVICVIFFLILIMTLFKKGLKKDKSISDTQIEEEAIMTDQANGRTKATDEKFCSECGEIIKAKAEICPKCGVRQHAPPLFSNGWQHEKSRVVAALLAIFLGGLGIHKFYLEQNFMGVIYLLFCWTFIPAIIGFFEGIVYLLNSEESFQKAWGRLT